MRKRPKQRWAGLKWFNLSYSLTGGTYALFYYNGHAIGYGNDVYLVGKDTDLNPGLVTSIHAILLSLVLGIKKLLYTREMSSDVGLLVQRPLSSRDAKIAV